MKSLVGCTKRMRKVREVAESQTLLGRSSLSWVHFNINSRSSEEFAAIALAKIGNATWASSPVTSNSNSVPCNAAKSMS